MKAIKKDASAIVVAAAADNNFGAPLSVSLHSLITHLSPGEQINIFILSLGIAPENKRRISNILTRADIDLTVTFIEVDSKRLEALPELRHLSLASYLRLLLAELLPDDCDKVLYLDSDILVRKDVRPLWDLDVEGFSLLAAQEVAIQTVSHPDGLYNWKELGFDEGAPLFNAGILLVNLNRWREQRLSNILLQYAAEHKRGLHWADQDVLNAVCGRCWGEFDLTWNAQAFNLLDYQKWPDSELKEKVRARHRELLTDPAICHFVSQHKPWLAKHKPPFQNDWLKAFKSTGWYSDTAFVDWLWRFKVTNYVYALRWQVVSRLKLNAR